MTPANRRSKNGKRSRTPTTVRGVLNMIDRFLVQNDNRSRQLWSILAALRGPDNTSARVKEYTALVRRTAFPLTAQSLKTQGRIGAVFFPSFPFTEDYAGKLTPDTITQLMRMRARGGIPLQPGDADFMPHALAHLIDAAASLIDLKREDS